MDLNFGTPARLERQIAQDLLETQSEFDLSLPGGDTRDISASITRTPLAPSNRHNSSFSRPSDSSEASTTSPSKHTHLATPHANMQPVTLAAAVQNARDVSDHNAARVPHAISASSSTSSVSDSPHSAKFPDPYSHVRSTSPPLTSTPHRTIGPASTVGSRSRTTVTARPHRPSSADGTATQRYDETTKTSASASRATRSARSASAVLDDLTESSIALEDALRHEQDGADAETQDVDQHPKQGDGRDFVVYDAPSAPSTSQHASPTLSQGQDGDAIDWRQRRAQRRQLVQVDESAVDDDESQVQPDTDAHTHVSSQPTATIATRASSVAETEDTATAYSSPAAARLARQGLMAGAAESATSTPSRPLQGNFATPKQASDSEERARMKQYLLNSVKATDRTRPRNGKSSDAHLEAIERLKAQAQLHKTPGSLSEGDARTHEESSPVTSTDPTPRRRMDRLGKANTIAAGRTPLPKGGVAELLRRGALFGVSDSSNASSALAESPLRAGPEAGEQARDDEAISAVGSTTTYSEASSNDLALAPNGSKHGAMGLRANTSFPGLGAADAGTEANSVARPRVDAAKLALYQSKLNARLDAENDELKRERDQLLQKLAKLEAASSGQSAAQPDFETIKQQLQSERERADALDREAQELADLLDDKERELESLKSSQGAPQASGENEQELREEVEELQGLLKERDEDIEELEARLERERTQMEEQVQQAKAFSFQTLDRIETERDQALERIQNLEAELSELREQQQHSSPQQLNEVDEQSEQLQRRIEELESERTSLKEELQSKTESNEQMASELEQLQDQARSDAARIRGLERRLNAANAQLSKAGHDADDTQSPQLETLKNELRDAREHIAELEAKAKDQKSSTSSSVHEGRIRFLERQKAELEERVQEYREMISKGVGTNLANLSKDGERGDATSLPPMTPGRTALGSSPLPKSVMSLRNISAVKTPRSPGPLSEASWLYNESSLGAANVVDRIAYLEGALDEANASIDAKLQQLDEAGVAHLTLAERLQQAHERIAELEAEIERLRMAGGQSADASTASPSKSVSQRQKVFADVHAQLEALKSRWAADHDKLQQREREIERRERELQDRSTEKRQYQEVLAELNRFKEAASSLQQDLHNERAKQRNMLAETRAASHQKDSIEGSLACTQAELDAIKRKLEEKMGGLEDLGRQYMEKAVQPDSSMGRREKAQLDSQTERLAERFQAAQTEVELLKAERNDLLSQRAQLHKKFADANENYEQVLADLAASRSALAEHQAQLDEQIVQMEAAHAALRSKKAAYEKIAGDRDRLRAERDLIVHDVGMFEQELRKLRREADRQGQDLEALRAEREQARHQLASDGEAKDRERAEFMLQVRTLVDQLKSKTAEVDRIKTKLDELERSRTSSAPPPYAEEPSLLAARKMHEAECKGLILQIKYLKLKLNREMDLRADLTHQKQYISLLLQGLTRSDAELGRLIFDLDLQHHARDTRRRQTDAKRRWNKALNAAIAVARMQLLAKKAGEVAEIKQSLQKAHEEVKSRRNVLPVQRQKAAELAVGADLIGFKAGLTGGRR